MTERPTMAMSSVSIDEADVVASYRTLSVAALVGLLFGLASPLVLLRAPLLMAIPLVGIGISAIALIRIQRSSGQLMGRPAAVTGLALAVFFAAAAPSRNWFSNYLISRQAGPVARQWLSHLLAGEPEQAFALTTDAVRAATTPSGGQPSPGSTRPSLDDSQSAMIVNSLMEFGPEAKVDFVGTMGVERRRNHIRVLQHYRVAPATGPDRAADQGPLVVAVLMYQDTFQDEAALWRVENYFKADAETGMPR